MMVGDFRKVIYTLLCFEWITNGILLYSTWNSAQCYVPAWMGKGLQENGYMYIMAESLHCSREFVIISDLREKRQDCSCA